VQLVALAYIRVEFNEYIFMKFDYFVYFRGYDIEKEQFLFWLLY